MKKTTVIFICIALGLAIVYLLKANIMGIFKQNMQIAFPAEYQIYAWSWEKIDSMSQEEIDALLSQAKSGNVKTIYFSLDGYLDLIELDDLEEKQEKLKTYEQSIHTLMDTAKKYDIKIQAMAGNVMWANDSHHYLPLSLIDYVKSYNDQNENKFEGIHFDIEFYTQDGYEDNAADINAQWLILLDSIAEHMQSTDLKIGVDMAFWLDEGVGNQKPIIFETLDKLNQIPNSQLVIMAYRTHARGSDSITEIIEKEIDYVKKNNLNVEIIIGQETAQVKERDKRVTYYGTSKNDLKSQINQALDQYKDVPQIKGVAIHHLKSYLELP